MFLHLTVNLDSIQGLFICIAFAWIKLTYQDEILRTHLHMKKAKEKEEEDVGPYLSAT